MTEVKLGRYAGPYRTIPYDSYIQSPIGLVPKGNGSQTRLIFHLSYDFGDAEHELSFNHYTPDHLCKVKYHDLDHAVACSLNLVHEMGLGAIFYGKADLTSAFRLLPCLPRFFKYMFLKAEHPVTHEVFYFADKNVPFGAARSCALFTEFSECLRHILEYQAGGRKCVTNYLDDFLFIAPSEPGCNRLVRLFIDLCQSISCPLSEAKTEWGCTQIVFLGILLDGENLVLAVPAEKQVKAKNMLQWILGRKSVTVKELQRLTGLLNFLGRAIFPGRAFTRRMYAKFAGKKENNDKLKSYHHVRLDLEFRSDCDTWLFFLKHYTLNALCRPFVDLNVFETSVTLNFYTDASMKYGCGCYFNGLWIKMAWPQRFIYNCKPSIEFLELYALCVGVMSWTHLLENCRVVVFCDNISVRDMVNSTSSTCRKCMTLIRMLVLDGLVHNRRVFVKHVLGRSNILADSLSRDVMSTFWKFAPKNTSSTASCVCPDLSDVVEIWKR